MGNGLPNNWWSGQFDPYSLGGEFALAAPTAAGTASASVGGTRFSDVDLSPHLQRWTHYAMVHEQAGGVDMIYPTENSDLAIAIAERGLRGIVFNPCAVSPTDGDYMDVMRANDQPIVRHWDRQ